jgi:DNA processing protein
MDEVDSWRAALRSAGANYQPNDATATDCRRWLADPTHSLLVPGSGDYPQRLLEMSNPPAGLFCRGDSAYLDEPQLAIVGSRNATRGGLENAEAFARALASAGLIITSGLALGIDGAAHRGALKAGPTVAVLGSGLERIYPNTHQALAEEIANRGVLVSEYPPNTASAKHHFPERNRIIAGLSLGTLVIEAATRSGALITARLAGDAGREVFAVPGSIHNPLARGCHRLLRDGATLVEQVEDVMSQLAPSLAPYLTNPSPPTEDSDPTNPHLQQPEYRRLLEGLSFDPVHVDELGRRTGLTSAELSSMLLILELEGLVEALPGGQYSRLS